MQVQEDVQTRFLCESEHLVLRPNALYRFEVNPNCVRCRELAAIYDDEYATNAESAGPDHGESQEA